MSADVGCEGRPHLYRQGPGPASVHLLRATHLANSAVEFHRTKGSFPKPTHFIKLFFCSSAPLCPPHPVIPLHLRSLFTCQLFRESSVGLTTPMLR